MEDDLVDTLSQLHIRLSRLEAKASTFRRVMDRDTGGRRQWNVSHLTVENKFQIANDFVLNKSPNQKFGWSGEPKARCDQVVRDFDKVNRLVKGELGAEIFTKFHNFIERAFQAAIRNKNVFQELLEVYEIILASVVLYNIFNGDGVRTRRVVSLLIMEIIAPSEADYKSFFGWVHQYSAATTVVEQDMYRERIEAYVNTL